MKEGIIIKIKTWVCPNCGYKQDFDPNNEEKMKIHFPGVEKGHCPACFTAKNPEKQFKKTLMEKESKEEEKMEITADKDDPAAIEDAKRFEDEYIEEA